MTVQELIERLEHLPERCRDHEVRIADKNGDHELDVISESDRDGGKITLWPRY